MPTSRGSPVTFRRHSEKATNDEPGDEYDRSRHRTAGQAGSGAAKAARPHSGAPARVVWSLRRACLLDQLPDPEPRAPLALPAAARDREERLPELQQPARAADRT